MPIRGGDTFIERVFIYVLIFSIAIPCPRAFAPPLTVNDLTPAERAIYEMYLNPKPEYRIIATPNELVQDPIVAEDDYRRDPKAWINDLTPQSYHRLAELAPQLPRLVREGQEARKKYGEDIIAAAKKVLYEDRAAPDFAGDLRASYLSALKQYRKREQEKVPELEAKLRADEITRRKYQIDSSLPVDKWDREAQRNRAFLIELFKDETRDKQTKPFLSEKLFAEWKALELAHLDKAQETLGNAKYFYRPIRSTDTIAGEHAIGLLGRYLPGMLMEKLFADKLQHLQSTRRSLERFRDPEKGHGQFLEELEIKQLSDAKQVEARFTKELGGPSRDNGRLTRLARPELAWIAEIGSSQTHWYDRMNKRQNLRSLDEVLEPEIYKARLRAERAEMAKTYGKWAAGLAAAVAATGLVVGGMNYLVNHSFPSYSSQMAGQSNTSQLLQDRSDTSWNKTHLMDGEGETDSATKKVFFEVKPLNGKTLDTLPREFELSHGDDLRGRTRRYEFAPAAGAKPDFEIISNSTQKPLGRYLTIPWVEGYDFTPEISANGKVLRPNVDYSVIRGDHNGILIELRGYQGSEFSYKQSFYRGNSENLPVTQEPILTARELEKLEAVAGQLEEAKLTKLAEGLRAIVQKGKEGHKVSATDLRDAVAIIGHYGGKDAARRDITFSRNRFQAYSDFADTEGIPFIECDTAASLLKDIYVETLVDHPNLDITRRSLLVRGDKESKVTSPGHAWVSLVEPGHSPAIMDGTPFDDSPTGIQTRAMKERAHPEGRGLKLPWWWPAAGIVPLVYALRKRFKKKKEEEKKKEPAPGEEEGEIVLKDRTGEKRPVAGAAAEEPIDESEAERQARELRNAERERWLRELEGLRKIVVDNLELVDPPKPQNGEQVPHTQAVQAMMAIENFVRQTRPVSEAETAGEVMRLLGISAEDLKGPVTLKNVLAVAKPIIEGRVNALYDQARNQRRASRFAPYIDPDLVRPSLALLGALSNRPWSPIEKAPVAKKSNLPTCPAVLGQAGA